MKHVVLWGSIVAIVALPVHARWAVPATAEIQQALSVSQGERRAMADSLPRENRIQSIRETPEGYVIVIELAAEQNRLDIGVYNLLGKRIVTVYQGRAAAGVREYPIPTSGLPNGIYICIVQGDGFRLAQKFVLSR